MTRSLQFRLSAWLSMLVVAIAIVAGVIAFETAYHEANELQDGQLEQIALLITPTSIGVMEREAQANFSHTSDFETKLVIHTTRDATLPDGLQNAQVDGVPWRLVVKTLEGGTRVVVGQQTAARDEIAHNSAIATVMPFAMLALVLLAVLHLVVRRMFRPLTLLAASLDKRPEHDLSALSGAALPSELTPFVVAINRLLARVEASVAAQRRFVADAAHELRSPLTALSLQAERLDATEMSVQARTRLTSMRSGIDRSRKLLNQLLTLARLQDQTNANAAAVRVQDVFRHVLEDLVPLAQARRIDVGVSRADEVVVQAPESDLTVLVRNLVDNAIRYSPEGGSVDLSTGIREGVPWIRISDGGPGITPEERVRVFDPFYRVIGSVAEGSGLGLSIVATIAARIGARIDLSEGMPQGLVVTVTLAQASSINEMT